MNIKHQTSSSEHQKLNFASLELAGMSDITIVYNEITKVTGAVDTTEEM